MSRVPSRAAGDLTAIDRAIRAAVDESERRFRLIAENSRDLIQLLGPDLVRRYVSPSCREMLGYEPDELLGTSVLHLVHPDDLAALPPPEEIVLAAEGGAMFTTRALRADGTWIWLETTGRILRDRETGAITEIHTSSRDVTERVRIERELLARERWFTTLVGAAADVIDVLDEQGTLTYASPSNRVVLGYEPEQVVGRPVFDFVHPDDLQEMAEAFLATVERGERQARVRCRVLGAGSRVVPMEVVGVNLLDDPHIRGVLLVARDMTERDTMEAALAGSEERYRALVEANPDLILRLDADRRLVDVHAPDASVLPQPADDLIGQSVGAVLPHLAAKLRTAAGRADATGRPPELGYAVGDRAFEARTVPLADGGLLCVVRDVTDRVRAERALEEQALQDALTGLANRALLLDRLGHALDRTGRQPRSRLAVLFIDLDRFKVVNDSLGHEAGDRLLRSVAERVRSAVRPGDTVARLGGDEFAVVCEELAAAGEAMKVAERIRTAVAQPLELEGTEVTTTASIGIALSRGFASTPSALLRDADAAMYRAKDLGRNRAELFDESLRAAAVARLETDAELRQALRTGQFLVNYQPEVDLATGEIVGLEALVRWRHPTQGVLGPDSFLLVAEESGLITEIGAEVLARTCADAATWHAAHAGRQITAWVNVSARQLADADLPALVESTYRSAGLPPHLLGLEVTETAVMTDAEQARHSLQALRDLGVRIAVDDFGTGYSSLTLLRQLPVDLVKIDRSFIDGLGLRDDDTTIVTAVVDLVQHLGLTAVAEGIESPLQLRVLRSLGCALGQGFLLARPSRRRDTAVLIDRGCVPLPI